MTYGRLALLFNQGTQIQLGIVTKTIPNQQIIPFPAFVMLKPLLDAKVVSVTIQTSREYWRYRLLFARELIRTGIPKGI